MKISLEVEVKSIQFNFDERNNLEFKAEEIKSLHVTQYLGASKPSYGFFDIELTSGWKFSGPVEDEDQFKDLRILFECRKRHGGVKWQKTL